MTRADLPLVRAWLLEPHVSRWFLAGSTIEHEVAELRSCVAGDEPTHALVVVEGRSPIGWCQWYFCRDYPEHAAGVGADGDDIGLDYAIGDPSRIGQGLGTELIRALIAYISERHPGSGLVADPEASNIASCKVLEKNGFELVAEGRVDSEPTDARMAIYRLPPAALGPSPHGTTQASEPHP
jgi:aminoglycoside 6'-N-acetyltransferase